MEGMQIHPQKYRKTPLNKSISFDINPYKSFSYDLPKPSKTYQNL